MSGNVAPNIITDGLVFYVDAANTKSYPGSGTVWNDISKGGNNGTLTNGPTFDSANGGSIVFDGVNDYLQGSDSQLPMGSSNRTICCWIKRNRYSNNTDETIWNYGDYGVAFRHIRLDIRTNNSMRVVYYANDTQFRNVNILQDIWYQFTLIQDGTTCNDVKLYINTIQQTKTNSNSGTINTIPDFFSIARRDPQDDAQYFRGDVSNIQIYNRALTPQEILQNYNATKTRYGL